MSSLSPTTEQVIDLVAEVITPLFTVERTMVMPFDIDRHENVGEHSLALGLLAGAMAEKIDPTLDTGKVTEFALVHNIVEIHAGDVTVWQTDEVRSKMTSDKALAAERILKDFPVFPWMVKKYEEYERKDTPEARFVFALDKIYPHILILIADHHPVHPTWEAYKRTEEMAIDRIGIYPPLLPLFKELCDMFRKRPQFFSTPIPPDEQR